MSEEAIIAVDNSQADNAAAQADNAAENANAAAAGATAATIETAAVLDIVTSAAREDAARSRDQAEQAAQQSEQAAELTVLTLETFASEMRGFMEDHERRLAAMENKPEPQVVQSNEVNPIDPAAVQEEQHSEESMNQEEAPKRSGRRHGRKRR